MNLLIFGATGATGRQLVEQALAQGHKVTAFARQPANLQDMQHERLRIVEGDVLRPSSIAAVMPGHDAVLIALGVRSLTYNTVLSSGTANIIWQMHQFNVQRLVVLSSLGVGESRKEVGLLTRLLTVGLLQRKVFEQKDLQEQNVRNSGLDWVIVRPTALYTGPATGRIYAGPTLRGAPADLDDHISRADVAAFMLAQLRTDKWLRKSVAVTGADEIHEDIAAQRRPRPELVS